MLEKTEPLTRLSRSSLKQENEKNNNFSLLRHFAIWIVNYSDEIANRNFSVDFLKVVDFIEEMDGL